jgi:hypothetical protein
MKKLLPLILILLFSACDLRSKQKQAEKLVDDYLTSRFNPGNYAVTDYGKVDTIFVADSSKAGSAQKPAQRAVKGWYIYTTYIIKNKFGNVSNRTDIFITDADCSKIIKTQKSAY